MQNMSSSQDGKRRTSVSSPARMSAGVVGSSWSCWMVVESLGSTRSAVSKRYDGNSLKRSKYSIKARFRMDALSLVADAFIFSKSKRSRGGFSRFSTPLSCMALMGRPFVSDARNAGRLLVASLNITITAFTTKHDHRIRIVDPLTVFLKEFCHIGSFPVPSRRRMPLTIS